MRARRNYSVGYKYEYSEGYLRYEFGGRIFGGASFRNFTVLIGRILNTHFMRSNQERKIKQFEGIRKTQA